MKTCKKCGQYLNQVTEKALNGESALVWVGVESWVCPTDGDEHEPA